MNPLSSKWRSEVVQLRDAANQLLTDENAEKLAGDVRMQISAVVGKVCAKLLEAQADQLDYLIGVQATDEATLRRRVIMERNDAIRRAAAKGAASGDWSEFYKLSAGFGTGEANGSGGPSSGSA